MGLSDIVKKTVIEKMQLGREKLESIGFIPKPIEHKLVVLYDFDGTLKKHSPTEIKLHNLLITSSMNREESFLRESLTKFANIYAQWAKNEAFQDTLGVAKDFFEFGPNNSRNIIYTLNSERAVSIFLDKNNATEYFRGPSGPNVQSVKYKNEENFTNSISYGLIRYINEIQDNHIVAVIGDSRCDLTGSSQLKKIIKVAVEGPLEKKRDELKQMANIYIPETIRENPAASQLRIYEGFQDMFRYYGVSPRNEISVKLNNLVDTYSRIVDKQKN